MFGELSKTRDREPVVKVFLFQKTNMSFFLFCFFDTPNSEGVHNMSISAYQHFAVKNLIFSVCKLDTSTMESQCVFLKDTAQSPSRVRTQDLRSDTTSSLQHRFLDILH